MLNTRVLIDLRWMIPGYSGGMEMGARAMLETLIQAPTSHEFTLLLPTVTRYDFDLRQRANFQLQISDGPGSYLDEFNYRRKARRARRAGQALPGTWINAQQSQARVGVSFSGAIQADLFSLKNLVVIHDLQHEFFPQFFDPQELQNLRRDLQATITHADCILAVSNFTRQTLLERFALPAERVITAYQGTPAQFSRPVDQPERVWHKYGLSAGQYLFYPAATWPHKNHRLVLQALAILKAEHGFSPPLACTGAAKEAHLELLAMIQELRLADQVQFLGFCPQDDFPALYQGAAALVFPSLFEGFGLPVLEAMASGCLVICSQATSLPEVAGDAARMIDPQDAAGLAAAIYEVIHDPVLRQSLAARGRLQATRFTWESFVAQMLHQIDRLAESSAAELSLPRQSRPGGPSPRQERSRDLIYLGRERRRQGHPWGAFIPYLAGLVRGPDVFFNLVFFPTLRDRLLRPLLKKLKL